MAAGESRVLVGATTPFENPNASRPKCLSIEREQKTEQQLEVHGTIEDPNGKCIWHLTRGADSQKHAKG